MPPDGIELQLVQVGSADDVDGPALQEQDGRGAVFVDQPTKKKMRIERVEQAARRRADREKEMQKQKDRVLELIRAAARGYYCEHCNAIYHHQRWLQRHVETHHPEVNDDDSSEDDADNKDGDDDDDDDDDDDNGGGGGAAAPARQGGRAAPAVSRDHCARSQSTAARMRTKAEQDQQLLERRQALDIITISASSEQELTEKILTGAAFLLPEGAQEISRGVAADSTHRAEFRRRPPVYRRGQARPPGERKGFTPTVQVLKRLLPLYHAHKHGSGISMYRLREELIKSVTEQEAYLIPTLEQLDQAWKAENERKNKALLAIDSRVMVKASRPQDEWLGTIVGRSKAYWYVKKDGDSAAKPFAKLASDLRLHESDPLFATPTHGGRVKAAAV